MDLVSQTEMSGGEVFINQGLRDKDTVILSFLFINQSPEETKTNCRDVFEYLHC